MRSSLALVLVALGLGTALGLGACGDPPPPEIPVLTVDAGSYFVSREPVEGAWYAGQNVQCVLLADGPQGPTLVGRLTGEEPVTLWTQDDVGVLVEQPFALESTVAPLTLFWEATSARAVSTDVTGRFFTAATRAHSDPQPEPPAVSAPLAWPEGTPPAAGTSLLGWAPAAAVTVRFRSVETGYRIAGLLDTLAERLLVRDGISRDHGTLRMTLHDLLLPTIWRTNPGGAKGVSECALVLPSPLARGRLKTVALLRVTDATLHHQHVEAGVGLEAQPDHLWRPADDPFPELRSRRNTRRVLGDVEVIATDGGALRALLSEGPRWSHMGVAEEIDQLPQDAPPAAVVVVPAHATWSALDVVRESRGLAALASDWCGGGIGLGAASPEPIALPPLRWLVVHTDGDGASVTVELRTVSAAADLAAVLSDTGVDAALAADACESNLADLVPLGLVERDAANVAERCFVWLGWKPLCPNGGTYRFHPITAEPSCTAHGTRLESREGDALPALPISDVVVSGARVTFRYAIDWRRRE